MALAIKFIAIVVVIVTIVTIKFILIVTSTVTIVIVKFIVIVIRKHNVWSGRGRHQYHSVQSKAPGTRPFDHYCCRLFGESQLLSFDDFSLFESQLLSFDNFAHYLQHKDLPAPQEQADTEIVNTKVTVRSQF